MYVSSSVIADVSSGSMPQNPVSPTSIDLPRSDVLPPGTFASIHSRIVIRSNAFAAGPACPHRYGPTFFASRTSRRITTSKCFRTS